MERDDTESSVSITFKSSKRHVTSETGSSTASRGSVWHRKDAFERCLDLHRRELGHVAVLARATSADTLDSNPATRFAYVVKPAKAQ